jgi:hypothetical protein
MSDGVSYEVRHPELLMVGLSSAVVGFPDPSVPGAYARTEMIALRHIVRIEWLESPEPTPSTPSN